MTQTQVDDRAELRALAQSHAVPSEPKLERRLASLERMRKFYESKIPEAPDKQAQMFLGFVAALHYAMTMITMYRKLTHKLNDLAEGVDDETRLNREG